jgi:hypothetical protein
MKKVLIVLLALLCAAGMAFAADKPSAGGVTPLVDKGDLLVNAGIGWGGISGGAEFDFFRIDIAQTIPLTFGAAARVFIDPGLFSPDWTTFAVGGMATAHLGIKGLKLPDGMSWASRVDAYAGLGLGFASGSYTNSSYYDMKPGLGLATVEGGSYYLNDKLALYSEYGYIGRVKYEWYSGYYSGSYPVWYWAVGAILKL